MAKAAKDAICMFCMEAPCVCGKPAKKAIKPKKTAAKPKKVHLPCAACGHSWEDHGPGKDCMCGECMYYVTEVPVAPEEDVFADVKIPEAKRVFKGKAQERTLDLSLLSALAAVREIVTPLERRRIDDETSRAFRYSQETDKRIEKLKTTLNGRRGQ